MVTTMVLDQDPACRPPFPFFRFVLVPGIYPEKKQEYHLQGYIKEKAENQDHLIK